MSEDKSASRRSRRSNAAAWIRARQAHPFVVDECPLWEPKAGELLIETRAVAINPLEMYFQVNPPWEIEYPSILGSDVAGVVRSVGPAVKNFAEGDRVVAHTCGTTKEYGTFQKFCLAPAILTAHLPAGVPFKNAAVLPLGLSTAACGLFQDSHLNLNPLPVSGVPAKSCCDQSLLIWGGGSSVGSNAIQMAVAAGYEVIAVASAKNFDYVKRLGASQVFDYKEDADDALHQKLVAAFKGKFCAGALHCAGFDALVAVQKAVADVQGRRLVATVVPRITEEYPAVKTAPIWGGTLKDNEVGPAAYAYLEKALAAGRYECAPEAVVVGDGLEKIQEAVDRLRVDGASACKYVVTLEEEGAPGAK